MDKADKIMVFLYACTCVAMGAAYITYIKRSEKQWGEELPKQLFEHIDRTVEQQIIQLAVAEKASQQ